MRSWFVVLLLVLAAGAVWLTTNGTDAPQPETTTAVPPPEVRAPATAATAGADSGAAATPTPPAAPVRIEATPVADDDVERLAITVVRKDSGVPVAGAEVLFLLDDIDPQTMSAEERELRARPGVGQEAILRRFGSSTRADADGVVRIPEPKKWATLVGLHEQDGTPLYGELTVSLQQPKPEAGWQLQLERDRGFRVEVTDAAGEAVAGVKIAVLVPLPVAFTGGRGQQMPMVAGETDSDGRLLVSHVQNRRSFGPASPADELQKITAIVYEPGIDLQHEVSFVEPVDDVVRFVLPPCGRLVVEVVDGLGEPVQQGCYIAVAKKDDKPSTFFSGASQWQQLASNGRATFHHVALGLEWTVRAYIDQQSIEATTVGPVTAQQEVRERLRLDPNTAVLLGRALDENGEPLATTMLQLQIEHGRGSEQLSSVMTEADGRFRFGLSPRLVGREIAQARLLVEAGAAARVARLALGGVLSAGTRDLGDVRLVAMPLLANGKLTGDDERILSGVTVRVERCQATDGNRERWQTANALLVLRDGVKFAVHGEATGERLRLAVWSQRHPPIAPLEFAAGQRGLEIALVPGGSVRAVVLHDEAIPAAQLRVRLRPQGAPASATDPVEAGFVSGWMPFGGGFGDNGGRGSPTASARGRTTFEWFGLSAGAYDLTIDVVGNERALFEARGVDVVAGEHSDDERLRAIDLRGRLRSVTLRIVDADGKALTDKFGTVLFRDQDGAPDPAHSVAVFGGQAMLLLSAPSVDLLVSVQGYRPVQLDNVFEDTTVRLSPGPSVRLRVRRSAVELPADATVGAFLTPEEPVAAATRDPAPATFTGRSPHWVELHDGEGTVQVASPGAFKLSVQVRAADRTSIVYRVEPARIEVRDTDAEQVFEIELRPRTEGGK